MKNKKYYNILGIDASRCRSGGALNHIVNIMKYINYNDLKFKEIHIWSYDSLLQKIPNSFILIKHKSILLELPLPFQLFWQAFLLKYNLKKNHCTILFTLDSSTLCRFEKHLILNQDLLSFEKDIYKKMPISYEKIRILLLRYVQKIAFKNSNGLIFLSNYSKNKILEDCKIKINSVVIAHGVDDDFNFKNNNNWDFDITKEIKCIYISPIFEYKNQINVVNALSLLREKGYNITLNLIGGGNGYYYENLLTHVKKLNKSNVWIIVENFLNRENLLSRLKENHVFIFASSCETFGITLLEGMSSGMPIICSNHSSLPELLLNGGLYFNPKSILEISTNLEKIILNKNLRIELSNNSKNISKNYTWEKCSIETFEFLESFI
jgi:glycosyltransferase involved in cell wall biosynthesis